jgi:hypothetical protein
MEGTWFLAATWLALALAATLLAIWLGISTALSEIVVGTVAQLLIGAFVGSEALGVKAPWITFLSGTGAIVLTFLAGAELVFDRRERERLRECIAHARDMLGTIADTFALEGNSRDVRRSIVARFSLLAIDARSATSHGLRSYGPVDDRLPAALDPLIEALARGLEAAVRNASGQPPEGRHHD